MTFWNRSPSSNGTVSFSKPLKYSQVGWSWKFPIWNCRWFFKAMTKCIVPWHRTLLCGSRLPCNVWPSSVWALTINSCSCLWWWFETSSKKARRRLCKNVVWQTNLIKRAHYFHELLALKRFCLIVFEPFMSSFRSITIFQCCAFTNARCRKQLKVKTREKEFSMDQWQQGVVAKRFV